MFLALALKRYLSEKRLKINEGFYSIGAYFYLAHD